MDPAAPNYDRPPPETRRRRRGALSRIVKPPGYQGGRPTPPSTAPISSLDPGFIRDPAAPAYDRSQAPHNAPEGNFKVRKNLASPAVKSLSDLSKPGKGGNQVSGHDVSQIGQFNATHKHGEPMKNMIAKLKEKRRKGPKTRNSGNPQSYSPDSGVTR